MLNEKHITAILNLQINQQVWIRESGGKFVPHLITRIFPDSNGNLLIIHLQGLPGNGHINTVLGYERIVDKIVDGNFRLFNPRIRRPNNAIK